jgi:hypothetical protein
MVTNQYFIFFQEKNWGRSEKLDIYFCPFLKYEIENLFLCKKKWVHSIMQQISIFCKKYWLHDFFIFLASNDLGVFFLRLIYEE